MKTLLAVIICIFSLASFTVSKINQQWVQEYHYASGNLKKVVNYKGDQFHGPSTLYFDTPEPTVKMELHYKEGKKTGFWTARDQKGEVIALVNYSK
jgi:antitoxin component YwqK of YwqJK toxin-antitoxin module